VVEGPLGELPFTADAVHDLQLERPVAVAAADRVDDEAEILDRLITASWRRWGCAAAPLAELTKGSTAATG